MPPRAHPKPKLDALTPAQRREEIAAILARAIVRLQQRGALHKYPTAGTTGQIPLDSGAEMPLSVANGPTQRLTPRNARRDEGQRRCRRN